MDVKLDRNNDVDNWTELMLVYSAALKQIETKIEILNEEFQQAHSYNPIEHIKSRLKTSESIVKKLKKHGYESTLENMVEYVNDIAGIRVICSFTSDIYRIADIISNQSDIKVISVKDYIIYPKPSGYKSYHMIVTIPVYLSDRIVDAKVEIQIRTVAMDFWASLEHKMNYKFEGNAPESLKQELVECAKIVSQLDERMLTLNEEVQSYSTAAEN
jgi:putative GTP pyrophosphokinase